MTPGFLERTLRTTTERFPQRSALEVAGCVLTYSELWGRSGELAHRLQSEFGRLPRVALLSSPNVETYVAYWSLVRLGWPVVPLNPEMPESRLAAAVRDAGATLLLHTEPASDIARDVVTKCPSLQARTVSPSSSTRQLRSMQGEHHNEAYTIFTSGSTGTPKGVPITNANLSAWLPHVIRTFATRAPARVAQTCDTSWDLSVLNMLLAWGTGGSLVVPDRAELVAPSTFINRESVTHWFSTPQSITLMGLLGDLEPDAMPTLLWSMFGGEPLRSEQGESWLRSASSSRLANVYGPTEFTCTCFNYVAPLRRTDWAIGPWGTLPIGRPLPQTEYLVIDESGQEAIAGELLLGGPQRFGGYVAARDNVDAFARVESVGVTYVADPTETDWYRTGDLVRRSLDASGRSVLFFTGRRDNQVKINGYRVELGEIEMVARECDGVDDVAAVAWGAEPGFQEIAAFYVGTVSREALLGHLRSRLPEYMVPVQVKHREQLPLSANGKVDRKRLGVLADATDAAAAAPRQ